MFIFYFNFCLGAVRKENSFVSNLNNRPPPFFLTPDTSSAALLPLHTFLSCPFYVISGLFHTQVVASFSSAPMGTSDMVFREWYPFFHSVNFLELQDAQYLTNVERLLLLAVVGGSSLSPLQIWQVWKMTLVLFSFVLESEIPRKLVFRPFVLYGITFKYGVDVDSALSRVGK